MAPCMQAKPTPPRRSRVWQHRRSARHVGRPAAQARAGFTAASWSVRRPRTGGAAPGRLHGARRCRWKAGARGSILEEGHHMGFLAFWAPRPWATVATGASGRPRSAWQGSLVPPLGGRWALIREPGLSRSLHPPVCGRVARPFTHKYGDRTNHSTPSVKARVPWHRFARSCRPSARLFLPSLLPSIFLAHIRSAVPKTAAIVITLSDTSLLASPTSLALALGCPCSAPPAPFLPRH